MVRLYPAHASMQFGDTKRQRESDLTKIFADHDYDWVTGTEMLEKTSFQSLKKVAKRHGYKVHRPGGQDAWIAVKAVHVKRGSFRRGYSGQIIKGRARMWSGKGIPAVSYEDKRDGVGRITILAGHLMTKGRPLPEPDPAYRARLSWNVQLTKAIGRMARKYGKGPDLVFYGGDQNIVDKVSDTFLGQPMTTCWDDLKKWPNTGHGNIDVIARYNKNGRKVKCLSARAFNDKKLHLHSDHFLIEAEYEVWAR